MHGIAMHKLTLKSHDGVNHSQPKKVQSKGVEIAANNIS